MQQFLMDFLNSEVKPLLAAWTESHKQTTQFLKSYEEDMRPLLKTANKALPLWERMMEVEAKRQEEEE